MSETRFTQCSHWSHFMRYPAAVQRLNSAIRVFSVDPTQYKTLDHFHSVLLSSILILIKLTSWPK